MLGAIIILLLIAAAAYAVTQIGGVITLLFIAGTLSSQSLQRLSSFAHLHGDLHRTAGGLYLAG